MEEYSKQMKILSLITFSFYTLSLLVIFSIPQIRETYFRIDDVGFYIYFYSGLTTLILFPFIYLSFKNLKENKLKIYLNKHIIAQLILFLIILIFFILSFIIFGFEIDHFYWFAAIPFLIIYNILLLACMDIIGICSLTHPEPTRKKIRKERFAFGLSMVIMVILGLILFILTLIIQSDSPLFFITPSIFIIVFLIIFGYLILNLSRYFRIKPRVEQKDENDKKRSRAILWFQYSLTFLTYLFSASFVFDLIIHLDYFRAWDIGYDRELFNILYHYLIIPYIIALLIYGIILFAHVFGRKRTKKSENTINMQ